MCGIIGYAGNNNTADILIGGLKKLEYRGYDSAGIALSREGGIDIYKNKGKVSALASLVAQHCTDGALIGIGHTRWATHGAPEDINAHPHRCGKVVLVHNGIIENDHALREELAERGLSPISETDTELIAILLNECYAGDPLAAIRQATARLQGSYALGILFEDRPDALYAIRKDSPLIIGIGEGERFIASDIPAILEHTHRYVLLEEGEVAVLTQGGVQFYDPSDAPLQKEVRTADWDEQSARKGGYPHFMAKEIAEQPHVVRETIGQYYQDGTLFPDLALQKPTRIRIVACGSAYHAGLLGKYAIEKYARIPVEVEIASEFRYADPILSPNDLVLIISQSGETADSLAALRLAKERGIPTLGIVNVLGSSLAREADQVLYTAAGPEISVATTKAYTCQVVLLYMLALKLAGRQALCEELKTLPALIEETLKREPISQQLAERFKDAEHLFFLGRGQDYYVSCEGSLKLKEISYMHSEAYAAGELKHGTISLIEPGTPVIAVMTDRDRLLKTLSNIREVESRGARLLGITHADTEFQGDRLELPACSDFLAPILAVILCQLFAYHVAVARGCEVDQPRNLAKSVTVE
ncbi:MAG: glutamine--fructose-6-phosphate transaminase (isomerizing) [Clostridia bacterium]|nr:glutamine--fructose-6-phosphate transaminase (isomerizing) [Clostridia bacterium]